ncbi:ABC-three component system protein [Brachyspira pilosicoli]
MSESLENKVLCINTFRQKLLFITGQEFENLFTTLMGLIYPNSFYQVRPQGKYGDGGNDGYLKGKGIYFQVYSPEEINYETKILNKLDKDLKKLIRNWDELEKIKEYNFVINDKFKNLNLSNNQKLLQICNKYKNININIRTSNWILNHFIDLSLEKQLYIIGHIPLNINSFDIVVLDTLSKVIKHIIDNIQVSNKYDSTLEAPNFDEKIKVNGLKDFAHFFKIAYFQNKILDDFYQSDPEAKTKLQIKIISLYKDELNNLPDNSSLDSVFYQISEKMIPNKEEYDNLDNIHKKNIIEAIYVILSYFFQVCDIGEPPSKFIN